MKSFKYFRSWKILKIVPEFAFHTKALKYVDEVKDFARLGDDGYTSFSGIKGKWKSDFPETVNVDGTSKVVLHHAIEQSVMTRYQGLISLEELHSIANLRGIPNQLNNTMHLSSAFIQGRWTDFYNRFEVLGRFPTKTELLDHATSIDDEFGNLFYPPIRN